MKPRMLLLLGPLTLLFALPLHAQSPKCDSPVFDETGNTLLVSNINTDALTSQGADVRIRAVGPTVNLDSVEKDYIASCPSWQAPNGGIKSTLVALMVSPSSRKMGIYYGHAFDSALNNHWNRIKTDYMTPHFKTGDFTGGMDAAAAQLGARLAASKDEALHPVQSTQTTINQPTDLSGLWWVLSICTVFAAIGGVIFWLSKKRQYADKIHTEQLSAMAKKNSVGATIMRLRGNGIDVSAIEEKFAQLGSTLAMDPSTSGRSLAEYQAIFDAYDELDDDLLALSPQSAQPEETVSEPTPPPAPEDEPIPASARHRHTHHSETEETPVEDHSTTIIAPVIVAEEEHHHHESDSGSRSHEDSDSGGGGSSGFDFGGGGSSDSGGGGSSGFDFGGGGGDSGGGGSSDF